MFRSAVVAFPLFVSSVAYADGTAVGHPVEFAGGSGLTFTSGYIPVSTVVFDRCDGTYSTQTVNANIDAVNGAELMVPDGWTCGIRINLSDVAHLEGTGAGGTFSLNLNAQYIHVEVETPIHVTNGTSTASLIELASDDWITTTVLGLSTGVNVTVNPGDTLHNTLRDRLRSSSAY